MKYLTLLIGIGLFIIGVLAMGLLPWFGWLELGLGAFAFFLAGTELRVGRIDFFPVLLGALSLALAVAAAALGLSGTIVEFTAGFAVVFFVAALIDAVLYHRTVGRGGP